MSDEPTQELYSFIVYGDPAPQGSKRAFVSKTGKAVVVEGGSKSGREKFKNWRQAVTEEGLLHAPDEPLTGPVEVQIVFYMPKPKSAPKKKVWCDKRPDIDKLARNVLDALTGPYFKDDGQVVSLHCSKQYVHPEAQTASGAWIVVAAVTV